jgi:hypothetical protein
MQNIKIKCMNKVWPQCLHDFRGFEGVPKIANEVAAIAQELGLDSTEPDDVTELLESHSQLLTNEELEDWAANLTQKQQQQEQ